MLDGMISHRQPLQLHEDKPWKYLKPSCKTQIACHQDTVTLIQSETMQPECQLQVHSNQAAYNMLFHGVSINIPSGLRMKKKQVISFTLRMSGVIGFGPREENEGMNGAVGSSSPSLFKMLAVGWLSQQKKYPV